MPRPKKFRTGTPSLSEWTGLWKCGEKDPPLSVEEFYDCASSLHDFLQQKYPRRIGQRPKLSVRGDIFQKERTQQIVISKTAVLTTQLLRQVQTWLRSGWPAWRVEIPTDGTLENVILVYPRKIRMNPAAESIENLAGYLRRMRIEMERIDSEQMERVH